ncbi:MAG: hypothetical protein G01um101448_340 [Parcubacteria group bacterium Gr01-1014_48]|nr:MAG: hypothetical protein Greene041614_1074 [Parcubacteria group bacterium Greene0416_14]TSC74100.1 MAG: hypothetical protein G01um101448_340 [Parcubacteria group bacterium Gr01-1014_48]TSD00130.1 MAG: hypothetical protein Greene101415_957 [Parcubacteria group bacterium Greene1014_15]TSD07710.1 MAG: hypothetical protein Greene07144_804 [Parcubacteria group bacterium Greene0714_4]
MFLPPHAYRKILGFALMLAALLAMSAMGSGRIENKQRTLRVEAKTIPYLQSHTHPEGDPDAPHSHWTSSETSAIVPMDMWITAIRTLVRNAPPDILHHVLLYELGAKNPICGNTFSQVREWYAASMNTMRDPVVFPEPYGIFFKKGTHLAIEAMEHTADEPRGPGGLYTNVEIAVLLDYIPAKSTTRTRPLDFYRLRLDDTPCAYPMRHEAFVVLAKSGSFIKKPNIENIHEGGRYVFNRSGTLIGFGANFWPWKGGKMMSAVINGKNITSLFAQKLKESWAWNIPQYNKEVQVQKGDVIEAYMEYENPYKDKEIKDASGMLGFYFAADSNSIGDK